MNQPCAVCYKIYWETEDFPTDRTFVCPDCKRQGLSVEIETTDHTEVLDEQDR